MSKIHSRDTKPELKLKNLLEKRGFIYQPKEFGRPDFINYKKKIVIFVDGCFWHKCPEHFVKPATNAQFWKKKINENARRDKEITLSYQCSGWRVIRIWTHQIKFLKNKKLIY